MRRTCSECRKANFKLSQNSETNQNQNQTNLRFVATCFVHSGLHLGELVQCCEENAFGDCRRCEQLGNQLPVRAAAHRLIFPIFPSQDVMYAPSQLLVLCVARSHTCRVPR
jgi:hypothetical protein